MTYRQFESKGWLLLLVACPLLLGQLCIPFSNNILEGIEDDLEAAEPITTFDGEWLSPEYQFSISITDRVGIITVPNSLERLQGEVVLAILEVDGNEFTARWKFQNGLIRVAFGELEDANTITMFGSGWAWTLVRVQGEVPEDDTP